MQLMTWTIGRLGSRFSLTFEPYHRRVMHSALGRFLDEPLDLMVGLVEPDGTRRVLPFTTEGNDLANAEQFERFNSITFRGYSETYRLRFELNIHSVFWPQHERLCLMPAFYMEMRINPVRCVRWIEPTGPTPEKVKLFIRIRRPNTSFAVRINPDDQYLPAQIQMSYRNSLTPSLSGAVTGPDQPDGSVYVEERIVSLNPGCTAINDDQGAGLECELPVTDVGSGTKWRLIWAAHTADPVLQIAQPPRDPAKDLPATFRYLSHWADVNQVLQEAICHRDDWLARSRRFEKLIEQAPIRGAKHHLLNQSFQSFLSNTFWCDVHDADSSDNASSNASDKVDSKQWFSVWDGSCFYHSTIDVQYNVALFYLALWPGLLAKQFPQWAAHEKSHALSGGGYLSHDLGCGTRVSGQAYGHDMPVEENANFLLLMQVYAHWTGQVQLAREHAGLIKRLADYLVWSDRDACGFPTQGVANTLNDAHPAMFFAHRQTYLAVKRITALRAAADLLRMADQTEAARNYEALAEADLVKVEKQAWLGDHYAVCTDRSAVGLIDVLTGKGLPYQELSDWDAYSINTANGLLLPMLIGQPAMLDPKRVRKDLLNAQREAMGRYGCGHSSAEPDNVWISQNVWRDHLGQYLGMTIVAGQRYWDLEVMSNTAGQSLGFIDTYVSNNLSFNPRGIASIGFLLAGPRLIIDRLAPGQEAGGTYITVEPANSYPQRWPLLPLADWSAGKVPICCVDDQQRIWIEGETDPVIIHGQDSPQRTDDDTLIG